MKIVNIYILTIFFNFIIDKLKLLLYNTIKDEINYDKEENYYGKRSSRKSK